MSLPGTVAVFSVQMDSSGHTYQGRISRLCLSLSVTPGFAIIHHRHHFPHQPYCQYTLEMEAVCGRTNRFADMCPRMLCKLVTFFNSLWEVTPQEESSDWQILHLLAKGISYSSRWIELWQLWHSDLHIFGWLSCLCRSSRVTHSSSRLLREAGARPPTLTQLSSGYSHTKSLPSLPETGCHVVAD
jgi:hypothetical protein